MHKLAGPPAGFLALATLQKLIHCRLHPVLFDPSCYLAHQDYTNLREHCFLVQLMPKLSVATAAMLLLLLMSS